MYEPNMYQTDPIKCIAKSINQLCRGDIGKYTLLEDILVCITEMGLQDATEIRNFVQEYPNVERVESYARVVRAFDVIVNNE